jgi:hypothetical protein
MVGQRINSPLPIESPNRIGPGPKTLKSPLVLGGISATERGFNKLAILPICRGTKRVAERIAGRAT